MLGLLQADYSLKDVLILITLCCIASKSIYDFCKWIKSVADEYAKGEHSKSKKEDSIQERFNKEERDIQVLKKNQDEFRTSLEGIQASVDLLVRSDKNDIKAWLTEKHHFYCYEQGWIDDFNLDCCERRFECYTEEHGNTFVEQLMEEIRALPRKPMP